MTPRSRQADPVILIHGAWAGAWVWQRLIPFLIRAGLTCCAVDLPGNGSDGADPATVSFESYLDKVHSVIDKLGRPVSLIAHSGGGNVATAVAERWPESVSRIVYVAAMMLPDGASFIDVVAQVSERYPAAAGINPHTVWSPDRRVDPRAAGRGRGAFFSRLRSGRRARCGRPLDTAGRRRTCRHHAHVGCQVRARSPPLCRSLVR